MFAVLDELGQEKALRSKVFEVVQASSGDHPTGLGLVTRGSQEAFAAASGIAAADFNAAYDSPEVEGKMARIRNFVMNADLQSVPSMVINGRYVISFFGGPGYYELAQRLIDQERERIKTEAAGAAE
jgi:hypothetical protein